MAKSADKKMASKSLQEEETAIKAYTSRKKRASSPKLKKALSHALGEERTHAASFRSVLNEKQFH